MPKPPAGAQPRLAINPTHAAAAAAPGAPQKAIPIRNLTAPPPKKKSPVATIATIAAVLVVLGAGGYFGYGYINKAQNNLNAASKEAAKNSDGGEAGHIAKLNGALAATDPNKLAADARPGSGPRARRTGVGQETPVSTSTADSGASAAAPDTQPLIPAVWTLDLTKARIPSGRANGSISGTNFVPDAARIDPVGKAQVLRLLQGQPVSPDREVLIYLHLKSGETLGGQSLSVSQDMAGAGVPQVTKRWKNNPKFAPSFKSFTSGYAMKLELGQVADGAVPGKIFLALPDADQSVVAGNFKAIINTNVATETTVTIQSAPVMSPTPSSSSADAAWQARYGTRRAQ
ncbi:MAG TPA: hypothetical protein VKY92_03565 [Verrucomicrobiae bacterium]|nr:hypothetical protein [Verrucomicrobiae bacterium]